MSDAAINTNYYKVEDSLPLIAHGPSEKILSGVFSLLALRKEAAMLITTTDKEVKAQVAYIQEVNKKIIEALLLY